MRKILVILTGVILALNTLSAQTKARFNDYEIVPKGEKLAGVQLAYYNLFSNDSELYLLLNCIDAKASFYNLSPTVGYAYASDKVIGARLSFSQASVSVDEALLSLLNDGLEFDISNASASVRARSASMFHRTYIGLDELGRIGLFYDLELGMSSSRLDFSLDAASGDWSENQKLRLSFNPGIVLFASTNISTHISVSVADISWNRTSYFEDGVQTGSKYNFKSQARLDLLGLRFGLAIHL